MTLKQQHFLLDVVVVKFVVVAAVVDDDDGSSNRDQTNEVNVDNFCDSPLKRQPLLHKD